MIIHTVKLTNFGIYGGECEFDLLPLPNGHFNRPVILFRGKNGVGKTTLVEAIRLCLHGSLAQHRAGQREFEEYLIQRIHHHHKGAAQPTKAGVEMVFEYVSLGRKTGYRVVREWEQYAAKLTQNLEIWEDGRLLSDFDGDQKERFLRELVPPGVIDLFFFDGEKIQTLAEDNESSHLLLAGTIKTLLGFDMVEQLGKDIDLFISRQESPAHATHLQDELVRLEPQQESIQSQMAELYGQQRQTADKIIEAQTKMMALEQKISHEGGKFVAQRETRLARQQVLETEIESLRRQVYDLCGGLFPFVIAPKMLKAVKSRLELEQVYRRETFAQQVIEERLDDLTAEFGHETLFQQVATKLRTPTTAVSPDEVILHLSEREQNALLGWIEQALEETPHQLSGVSYALKAKEQELEQVEKVLSHTPTDEALQPLFAAQKELYQQQGALLKEQADLESQTQQLQYRWQQLESQKARVREQLAAQVQETSRIALAIKAQKVLETYQERISQQKIHKLEQALVNCFNRLCRKKPFLDRVQIQPQTFQLSLYRSGKLFNRQQLSAGENQLFAIAILWALREVSERPMPVIIDTPLSRLDSEHRLTMTQEFLPHVSHQVIILGTDAEIDGELYGRLQPAISHLYEMHYDPTQGTILYEHENPFIDQIEIEQGLKPAFIQLTEIKTP